MTRVTIVIILFALLALSMDQWSKLWVLQNLQLGQTWSGSGEWVHILYAQNPGAAFGAFAQLGEVFKKIIFLSSPLLVIGFVIYVSRNMRWPQFYTLMSLGFMVGGALGNFADRLRFGFVIDFIAIQGQWLGLYWPIFNLADVFIVVGILFTVGQQYFGTKLSAY